MTNVRSLLIASTTNLLSHPTRNAAPSPRRLSLREKNFSPLIPSYMTMGKSDLEYLLFLSNLFHLCSLFFKYFIYFTLSFYLCISPPLSQLSLFPPSPHLDISPFPSPTNPAGPGIPTSLATITIPPSGQIPVVRPFPTPLL